MDLYIVLGVQREARNVRATQDGVGLRVQTAPREGYRLITVFFRSPIFYGESVTVGTREHGRLTDERALAACDLQRSKSAIGTGHAPNGSACSFASTLASGPRKRQLWCHGRARGHA